MTHPRRTHTPADLRSLAAWLRARCAQTSSLRLGIAEDRRLEALVGLLALRLEYAELHGTGSATLEQAPVDHLAVYGTTCLSALELHHVGTSVQLHPLAALHGLRTLRVAFWNCSDDDEPLEPFPAGLCNLSQLTKLELHYEGLQLLPDALSRLTALQHFVVEGSTGEDRPLVAAEPGLGCMCSLTHLTFDGCALPAVWPSFSGLTMLAELALEDCSCIEGSLPVGCCAAPMLHTLTCERVKPCGLDHLQPGELGALTSLTLRDCELREFPAAICQLRRLVQLDLACNGFAMVPRSISQLTSLEELDLYSDSLVRIGDASEVLACSLFLPVELARLSKLCRLDLGNTMFTLETGLGRGLAGLPDLWVQLRGSLPSMAGVRELVLLGALVHQQGRLEDVLDWLR